MTAIPPLTPTACYRPGDYEASFDELRRSVPLKGLATQRMGPQMARTPVRPIWNCSLPASLRAVGIREVFADGSLLEDKDHPNDIDGYFVCYLAPLMTGQLPTMKSSRPCQSLDVGPGIAQTLPRLPEEAIAHVASIPRRTLSARTGPGFRQWHTRPVWA